MKGWLNDMFWETCTSCQILSQCLHWEKISKCAHKAYPIEIVIPTIEFYIITVVLNYLIEIKIPKIIHFDLSKPVRLISDDK